MHSGSDISCNNNILRLVLFLYITFRKGVSLLGINLGIWTDWCNIIIGILGIE